MNCQKGDLARIISMPGTQRTGLVDRLIRVTDSFAGSRGDLVWHYEGPLLRCRCGCGRPIEAFADEVLRPIRDPGADAVDETLTWLPVPTTDEVPA